MDIYQHPRRTTTATITAPATSLGRIAVKPVRPLPMAVPDNILSQSAHRAIQCQQYDWALTLLNQLINRHPQRAAYYSNRGLVHLWSGHHQAALADCSRAIQLDASLDQAYNNRASCYVALGQKMKAMDDYEQAIDLNPFNIKARINLGITLRDLGNWDSALDQLDQALIFHQLPDFVYAERGRTYHLRGDWNCAIADYHRALAAANLEPSSPQRQHMIERVQRWITALLPAA